MDTQGRLLSAPPPLMEMTCTLSMLVMELGGPEIDAARVKTEPEPAGIPSVATDSRSLRKMLNA